MPEEPLPIYMRLLLISQGYKPEAISITPEDAKALIAAMDAVRGMRNAIKLSEQL